MVVKFLEIIIALLITFVFCLFVILLYNMYQEEKSCKQNGGKMVSTGKEESILTLAGDVFVVGTSEENKCSR